MELTNIRHTGNGSRVDDDGSLVKVKETIELTDEEALWIMQELVDGALTNQSQRAVWETIKETGTLVAYEERRTR